MAEAASDQRFDLVVATVDRTDDLDSLLSSLDAQTHRAFRVVVVDQNDDDRLEQVLAGHAGLEVLRLRAPRGLSRARNAALPSLTDPGLDGLAGRPVAADGRTAGRWPPRAQRIRPETVFHTAISYTIFLRLSVIGRVDGFDERLGLGSGTPWSSGEEIDFLARALHAGARIEYDPSLVVTHPVKTPSPDELVALGRRDGGSLGYILTANRYPAGTILRLLVRPFIAAVAFGVLLDGTRARFQLATLGGRLRGLVAGRARR